MGQCNYYGYCCNERVKGKACAIVKNGEVVFIGEDVMNSEIAKRSKNPYSDIPSKLKSVPKGLDLMKVAKLFYYVGGIEQNKDVWL